MTKADLIADIAERSGMSKAHAGAALEAVTASISAQLALGNSVELPGLAKFETRDIPARRALDEDGEPKPVARPRVGGVRDILDATRCLK